MSSYETSEELTKGFEEEQRTQVFLALADYLNMDLFTDVTLVCRGGGGGAGAGGGRGGGGPQHLRVHKIVLASSSKFFRDLFTHNPHAQVVDLDKELASNDLFLTFEDVKLIVGILYCVGTFEINPQRIQSLLVSAQVLGIPTLIRFLKRIRDSLGGGGGGGREPSSRLSYVDYPSFPLDHHLSSSSTSFHPEAPTKISSSPSSEFGCAAASLRSRQEDNISRLFSDSSRFDDFDKRERSSTSIAEVTDEREPGTSANAKACDHPSPLPGNMVDDDDGRPSRSQSRATLASFDSFSMHQLPSPTSREAADGIGVRGSIRVVNSVLESFDPSFLNNLPANQIDDLENALLPHLHSEESQPPGATKSVEGSQRHNKSATTRGRVNSGMVVPVVNLREFHHDLSLEEQLSKRLGRSDKHVDGAGKRHIEVNSPPRRVALEGFSKLLPTGNQNLKADPVILRPGQPPQPVSQVPSLAAPCPRVGLRELTSREFEDLVNNAQEQGSEKADEHDDPAAVEDEPEGIDEELVIDERERSRSQLSNNSSNSNGTLLEDDHSEPTEISVNLETVNEGKSFKFAIPGSSKSVTLNFSADALQEMRNSVAKGAQESVEEQEISSSTGKTDDKEVNPEDSSSTSSTPPPPADNQLGLPKAKRPSTTTSTTHRRRRRRLRGAAAPRQPRASSSSSSSSFKCHICSKVFATKSMLDRHLPYHVQVIPTCKVCGKLFYKKWLLEQHMAVDHGAGGDPLKCKDCDKVFKWPRNLLAHIQLSHAEEKRYRCKFCPLTFLQRKSYINHQQSKHADRPETWCKLCMVVFDSSKLREDHECPMFENTGSSLVCHLHDPPKKFYHQANIEEHLKIHAKDDSVNSQKINCPVCHKTFLMKKNLNTHMRRFHEDEGRKADHQCSYCAKTFYFQSDCLEHENTHTGEKNFHCHCGRKYSSKKALLNHQKLVHVQKEDSYACLICKKELSNKYKLKYHMSVHSEKRGFKCSHCDAMFKARENLSKHVVKKHRDKSVSATAGKSVPAAAAKSVSPAPVALCLLQPTVSTSNDDSPAEGGGGGGGGADRVVPAIGTSVADDAAAMDVNVGSEEVVGGEDGGRAGVADC